MDKEFLLLFGVLKTSLELIIRNEEGWDKYRMRNTAYQAIDCIKQFSDRNTEVKKLVKEAEERVNEMMG